jgi:hypothetical protein
MGDESLPSLPLGSVAHSAACGHASSPPAPYSLSLPPPTSRAPLAPCASTSAPRAALRAPGASAASAARLAETLAQLLRHEPLVALGGAAAAFDAAAAQQASGYGNITGYGAGARLLLAGAAGARGALLAARPGGALTAPPGSLALGASVRTEWGVARLERAHAAGARADVAFPGGSLGAACFAYAGHTATLPAAALAPAAPGDFALAAAACGGQGGECVWGGRGGKGNASAA